jgi:hypothetical protein
MKREIQQTMGLCVPVTGIRLVDTERLGRVVSTYFCFVFGTFRVKISAILSYGFVVFFSPSAKIPRLDSNLYHDSFLLHLFQFIIQ